MINIARQPSVSLAPARYDRQLLNAAVSALSGSKHTALHRLDCSVTDGVVEVTGTVPSFYLKQLAQAALMRLERVQSVRNLVAVSDEPRALVADSCEQGPGN